MALLAVFTFSCQNNTAATDAETTTEEEAATSQTVSNTETSDAPMGIKVGDKAPGFELKGVDGEMYSFDNITDTTARHVAKLLRIESVHIRFCEKLTKAAAAHLEGVAVAREAPLRGGGT